jgi:hypothetical protein
MAKKPARPGSRGPAARNGKLPLAKNEATQIIGIRDAKVWILLCCVTFIVYSPALQGGLLWDDDSHVTRLELQSLPGLWRIWSDVGAVPQYYPLLHSAFWIEHQMWGNAVLGYHLTNIVLHLVAAGLVVLIVKRLSLPGAWLAGFVFALHPIQVEAVAWISEQKSTLSAVFYLASALTYLYFDQTRRPVYYLFASGLFVSALLSKTVTATLPGALLVVFWWQRGRISWRRDFLPLVPWFAVGGAAGLFTAWVERAHIGARGADFALTLPQRLLLAGRAVCFYLGKLAWPVNLLFTYPHWIISPVLWWQYMFPAGVLVLAIGLLVLARRYRGPLAGFLIFAGTLFPVLGFLDVYPFRFSYVADHFQYLASLGVLVPAVSAFVLVSRRISLGTPARVALSAVLLGILSLLSWRQSHMYRDAKTLYRETLARNPGSWMAHNNLGNLLVQEPGRLPDAIAEFQAALRIKPDAAEAHLSLGSAIAHTPSKLLDAIPEFKEALRIKPDYTEAHYDFANALSHMPGRLSDAIAEYRAALRLQPDMAMAHLNLGNAISQVPGRLPDAIAEYEAALRIKPDSAEAHYNLGSALSHLPGRLPDAIAEFQAALRIKPDLEPARAAIEILRANPQ